ncbi:conserved protein of unknown function [Candidatus Nitrosotalea okcheonensis]|uniref:Uncharacterized protein n=1 Tax=Candidatus Nitrosotalea okcheonensis TaxID=1903276 RepID=A0A2H1FFL6_9ARCH|nr:conserved protein of unknown function [Candidatus Nitrosotalea okcheonensis]
MSHWILYLNLLRHNLWTHQNSGSAITVNGLDGVMHDMLQVQQDGETISQPAEIVVFKHGLMISITAMLSSDELIKVAETL